MRLRILVDNGKDEPDRERYEVNATLPNDEATYAEVRALLDRLFIIFKTELRYRGRSLQVAPDDTPTAKE